jgi:hypothetical protein
VPVLGGRCAIETFLTIILVVLLFLLIIGAVGIYAAVRLGKAAARKARAATARFTTQMNAVGPGDAAEAERLRLALRREVALTRQAVEQAERQGWGLGEVPHLVAELSRHAHVLDDQLGAYAQQRRSSPYIDHVTLDRLREQHAKLSSTCARIRADLLDAQVGHTAAGIDEVHARAQIEMEARRRTPDPLDEIDDLYRKAMADRPRPEDRP